MIKEWATVVSWHNGVAKLRCDVKSSCSGCASRSGCGTRVLNKLGPQTEHLLSVASTAPLVAGQKVELGIAEKSLLSSAFLVYMTPLLGMFLFAGVAQWWWGQDSAAMLGALIGGVGGFLVARYCSHFFSSREQWQPVILSVALSPEIMRVDSTESVANNS